MASSYGSSTFVRPPPTITTPYQYHSPDGTAKWKGPRRVCIFCLMALILPSLLISIPLLMRFVIYGSNTYVLNPSDTLMLNQRISTIWCEAETVSMNTTFTAYVTSGEPTVLNTPTILTLEQHMRIPDDQKEYWGLFLLPGSTFTVKTCAQFKGATLLIVRGNRHMQYCAYVGETDSAGNSDQVSGSGSFEYAIRRNSSGGGAGDFGRGQQGVSLEKGEEDRNILTRLKTFLQEHPDSRGKIKKTLEDWMLTNSSKEVGGTGSPEGTEGTTETPISEHGTIRRRRQVEDIRRDTESGENGAFENDTDIVSEQEEFILPRNASVVLTPGQTPNSIWKKEHSQHSGVINSSVVGDDGSMSESESSFSSSEEALLKCEGIIASFKIPHEPDNCRESGPFESLTLLKPIPGLESNAFQFQVKDGDYYYFIFGSENEKDTNSIRAKFELEKVEYQLPEPVRNCTKVKECHIPLGFWSREKVVVKLPQPLPEGNSKAVFVAETVCKPRSQLYLIFVILVPVVILLFAFK